MRYKEYIEDVKRGKISTGLYIKQAVEHFEYMKNTYIFKEDIVEDVINFISIIKHYKGKFKGEQFTLEPWQQFIIASVYGFYRENGTRVVKQFYIEMARKQGKSALGSAMSLNSLIGEGEASAEIYMAANSLDQAYVSYEMVKEFSKTLDPKGKFIKPFRREILIPSTVSKLKVLSSDDTKLDGLNTYFYLYDEYHAAKNNKLKGVLDSSQAMRVNPLGGIITTAGFDKTGPCYKYREMCVDVLAGVKKDDTIFSAIYCMDKKDDWRDEKNWIKCSPNLNVTVSPSFMREQITKATNDPGEEVNIKTKTFNIWCDSEETWISANVINAASKPVSFFKFKDKDIYLGIDLASVRDFTAVSALYVDEDKGKYYFKNWAFLPSDTLQLSDRYRILYGGWANRKQLHLTDGNVTDYNVILNLIMRIYNISYINEIAYDSWNATQFAISAEAEGLPLKPFSQTIGNFNQPTKELERLLTSGHVIIDNNEVTRFCFKNVHLRTDWNGNIKPDKSNADKKIDVVISMTEALGAYLRRSTASASL